MTKPEKSAKSLYAVCAAVGLASAAAIGGTGDATPSSPRLDDCDHFVIVRAGTRGDLPPVEGVVCTINADQVLEIVHMDHG